MTREEELDWLCRLRSEIYVYMPKEWLIPMNNALDMAISALSDCGADMRGDQAEVKAYFDGEAYGWEEGRKALLDDLRAEIEQQAIVLLAGSEHIDREDTLAIVDKYIKG